MTVEDIVQKWDWVKCPPSHVWVHEMYDEHVKDFWPLDNTPKHVSEKEIVHMYLNQYKTLILEVHSDVKER